MAKTHLLSSSFDESIADFENSISSDPGNLTNRISCLIGISSVLLAKGDSLGATKKLMEAKELDDKSVSSNVKTDLYERLSHSFLDNGDYFNSVQYFMKYNALYKKINDKRIFSDFILKEVNQRLEKAKLERSLALEISKSERLQKYVFRTAGTCIDSFFNTSDNKQNSHNKIFQGTWLEKYRA